MDSYNYWLFFCLKDQARIIELLKYLKFDSFSNPIQFITSRLSPIIIRITTATTIVLFSVFLLTGIYFMKKNSADGRLLIWNISKEIIKDHPLYGVGYGRFATFYNDTQAN